jgi:two-component system NtrC family sensor kinase
VVSLRELIQESVDCLGRDLAKDNIGVTIEVDPALKIRAHAGQMQQVLVNMIQNARQAMLGRRGRLTFQSEAKEGYVHLRISDIGSGIRSEDLPNIFTPFFSTKSHADRPDKRGIGLGLAVCRDIIVQHGGRIEVESRLGHGTTFTIVLPQVE